jgi:hypothetical protein
LFCRRDLFDIRRRSFVRFQLPRDQRLLHNCCTMLYGVNSIRASPSRACYSREPKQHTHNYASSILSPVGAIAMALVQTPLAGMAFFPTKRRWIYCEGGRCGISMVTNSVFQYWFSSGLSRY